MKITILGSGTSTGVPQMRCNCGTCSSADPADKRMRCSAMIEVWAGAPRILIDCGPDFRTQMLAHGSPELACSLITHIHYDHVGGLDDLRPYCYSAPENKFPLYCTDDVAAAIEAHMPYAFTLNHYPGAPTYCINVVEPGVPFELVLGAGYGNVSVLPIRVMHGKLPIVGYRIGDVAYITDCSLMPAESLDLLRDLKLLVINALRPEPHPAHFSLGEALQVVKELRPERTLLTHMSHDMPPVAQVEGNLPADVQLARDGMSVIVD